MRKLVHHKNILQLLDWNTNERKLKHAHINCRKRCKTICSYSLTVNQTNIVMFDVSYDLLLMHHYLYLLNERIMTVFPSKTEFRTYHKQILVHLN